MAELCRHLSGLKDNGNIICPVDASVTHNFFFFLPDICWRYLMTLCTVEFLDEVRERVRLVDKHQVASQTVSSHWNVNII